jgi:curli biogenesis system outer membrane secretion channel CsgG
MYRPSKLTKDSLRQLLGSLSLALSLAASSQILTPKAHAGVLDEEGGSTAKPTAPASAPTAPAPAPASTPSSVQPSVSQPAAAPAPSQPVAVSAPATLQPSASRTPLEAAAPSEKAAHSEQIPSTIAPKKKSKPSTTDLSSVPSAPSSIQPSASQASSDPYVSLAQALAQATGTSSGNGKINVGIGNFVYEDTDLLSPYSAMLKDELGIALPKAGKFEVITRERIADLQNEGKFQAKDIVEPGTEVKKVQIEGVQGMIRGRFYYQPPNLTIYAEIAYLDGGEVRKVKVVVPASEVAARIWPSDAQKQNQPEVAIAPQAVKESTASVQDVESKVRKVQKDFPIEIHTVDGKRGYAEGETVSFRCRSGHDAYIAVIDHQIDGSEILLFPNAFCTENYIPAGKAIDVPGTVKHGFEIQISPPFGSDVVQVIACTRKEDLDKITSTFPSSTQANPYAVRTRGMKVVAVDEAQKNTSMASQPAQWSEDHIVVSTYPKVN